ncbi:MAG TPA: hypothetical protein VLB46_07500 [Pyrinomonadaceae bacterium]|nr:hypothetical protein [Pyrinomonadaceae bacterium]
MKKYFNISLTIIILTGVLAVSAPAQTSDAQKMIASIPFAFSAGKTTLPAGKYTITVLNPASDRKTLQIRSLNGRASAIVLTMTSSGHVSDHAKLVFERYGDRYVFAQAQMAGDETALAAVRTKERGDKNIAKAGKKSIVVIVAE